MRRHVRRDETTSLTRAEAASSHARRIIERVGSRTHPAAIEAREVEADAWEDVGTAPSLVRHLRLNLLADTGRRWPHGLSPPHGIYEKRFSMTDLKRKFRVAGNPFFQEAEQRDQFFGPYVGFGGLYFIQYRRLIGFQIIRVSPDFTHSRKRKRYYFLEAAQREAMQRARG